MKLEPFCCCLDDDNDGIPDAEDPDDDNDGIPDEGHIFQLHQILKGQLQGHTAIFQGLKMTFRTKIKEKSLYHVNQHQKYYKLCFDNFFLQPLFLPRS